MKLTTDTNHQYIKEHIDSLANKTNTKQINITTNRNAPVANMLERAIKFEFIEYDTLQDPLWHNDNDDCYESVVIKDFISHEQSYNLQLLCTCALSAYMEHYHVKPTYKWPGDLFYKEQQIGRVTMEELDEHTYILDFYLHVNSKDTMSLKTASKKKFKIKDASLMIQTYFKIYYHFYETQDFNQVIQYANDLCWNKDYCIDAKGMIQNKNIRFTE